MSKYTTEVRFICEMKAGLSESKGFESVDEILSKSWNKIFTTNCTFFEESYRATLCQKILKHYYTREIGAETAGLWQLWMNTKLEEIMPYYNQLYNSEKLKFEPLEDVDVKREHHRGTAGTGNTVVDATATTKRDDVTNQGQDSTSHTEGVSYDLFQDTPQGSLKTLNDETYLTNAHKVTDDSTTDGTVNTNTTLNSDINQKNDSTTDNTYSEKENYDEHVKGKQGSGTFSEMLQKYRETFLNIDLMVIEEFEECFLGLW